MDDLRPRLTIAHSILRRVRNEAPTLPPKLDSPALLAFDPRVTRRLHNFIPMRIIELPPQEKVWEKIDYLLQGWQELDELLHSHSISAWDVSNRRLFFHILPCS